MMHPEHPRRGSVPSGRGACRKPQIAGAALYALALLTGACSGSVGEPAELPGAGPGGGTTQAGGGAGEKPGGKPGGAPGGAAGSGAAPAPVAACGGGRMDPGPAPLRRLTNVEYANTVRDLLGTSSKALAAVELPADRLVGRFDNNVDGQSVNSQHLEAYAAASNAAVEELLADSTRRGQVVGCDPAGAARATCVRGFIERFGRRAFRRPVEAAEVQALEALAAPETDGWEAVGMALRGILRSPNFLYRPELGAPAQGGLRRLTGYEVATRLSYTLLGTTPGDDLLGAAAKGALDTPEAVEQAARGLLADPRAKVALRRFTEQWFGLGALARVEADPKKFPQWTKEAPAAMAEETARLLEDFIWKDGADFLDVFTARYTYANATVAKLYDLPAPAGGGWQRVEFPATLPRAGLLTHPSLLTMSGRPHATSAIWRGKFVRESFLCQEMPPPPPTAGDLAAANPKMPKSERERLEQHRSDPACAGCHTLLDPLGFGLDRYTAVGTYREKDDAGFAISEKGTFAGQPSPEFTGAVELARKVREAPETRTCVARTIAQYGLGRSEVEGDACLRKSLLEAFEKSNHSIRETLIAFVRSDAFRFRSE